MATIDADMHFETLVDPASHPFAAFCDRFPTATDVMCQAMTGDLAAATPAGDRPPATEITPNLPAPNASAIAHAVYEHGRGEPAFVVSTPRERLRWMDEVGIDIALVNPGSWFLLPEFLE